jgi:hypothetical protein
MQGMGVGYHKPTWDNFVDSGSKIALAKGHNGEGFPARNEWERGRTVMPSGQEPYGLYLKASAFLI